jgi:CBS domain-containing protein
VATKVSELMLRDVALVSAEASVRDAARAMADSGCRVVLVGREDAVEGVLTQRDILIRVVVAGLGPSDTSVASVMSADLFTCREDQSSEEAAAEMAVHRVRQLPVLDPAGRLAGLLTDEAIRQEARSEGVDENRDADAPANGSEPAV